MTATIPTQTGPGNRDWRDDALCVQVGPDLFFLGKGESTKEAKQTCGLCPVRSDCLADALSKPANQDHYGVFGGLSERERSRLRRQA